MCTWRMPAYKASQFIYFLHTLGIDVMYVRVPGFTFSRSADLYSQRLNRNIALRKIIVNRYAFYLLLQNIEDGRYNGGFTVCPFVCVNFHTSTNDLRTAELELYLIYLLFACIPSRKDPSEEHKDHDVWSTFTTI